MKNAATCIFQGNVWLCYRNKFT